MANPGAYDISSLSTPLNALFAAGGPTSQGSLRRVKHYRGDQLIGEVDLYDLLLHGVKNGMARLENGDTVVVPPLGPQVTIEGMVRRPAIYELKDENTLSSVLALAGGLLLRQPRFATSRCRGSSRNEKADHAEPGRSGNGWRRRSH